MKILTVWLKDNAIVVEKPAPSEFEETLAYVKSRGPVATLGKMTVSRDDTFPERDRVLLFIPS